MLIGAKHLTRILIAFSVLVTASESWAEDHAVGKVVEVKGQVLGLRGTQSSPLSKGSVVYGNERIVTKADSTAILLLGNDAAILVKPDSDLNLDQDKMKDWRLDLKTGGVLSTVRSYPKRPDYFRIKSKNAVMGVRGTVFFVEAKPKEPLYVCTCKGTVSIKDPASNSEFVAVSKHHDQPKTIRDGSGDIKSRLLAEIQKDHADSEADRLVKLLWKQPKSEDLMAK